MSKVDNKTRNYLVVAGSVIAGSAVLGYIASKFNEFSVSVGINRFELKTKRNQV